MSDHTPTPWEAQPFCDDEDHAVFIIGSNLGGLVATAPMLPSEIDAVNTSRAQANAAFIVEAVNNYDAMKRRIAALELIIAEEVSPFDCRDDLNRMLVEEICTRDPALTIG